MNRKKVIKSILVIISAFIFVALIILLFKEKSFSIYKIKLDANATTGYSWAYTVSNEGIVKFIKDEYVQDNNPYGLVGVGGKQIYEIKGLKEGTVKIVFKYKQQWDKNSSPAKTKTIILVVDKNLNITEK